MRKVLQKNKKEIIIFAFILLIEVIIFYPWLKGHYSVDTYIAMNLGYKESSITSLKDGRVFMYLIKLCGNWLDIPMHYFIIILLFFSLIISTLSCLLIRRIILKYKKEKKLMDTILNVAISYITIFNFMYIDNLYFIEGFVMSISVFLTILVSKILADGKKNWLLKSLVFTIISVFMYQGTISILIAMYILQLLMKYPKNLKKVAKHFFIGMGIVSIGVLTNILLNSLIYIWELSN